MNRKKKGNGKGKENVVKKKGNKNEKKRRVKREIKKKIASNLMGIERDVNILCGRRTR